MQTGMLAFTVVAVGLAVVAICAKIFSRNQHRTPEIFPRLSAFAAENRREFSLEGEVETAVPAGAVFAAAHEASADELWTHTNAAEFAFQIARNPESTRDTDRAVPVGVCAAPAGSLQ